MKILVASDNFLPRWDGISRFLYEVIPALEKQHEITLLVPEGKEEFTKKRNKIGVRFTSMRVGDFIMPMIPLITAFKAVKHNDVVFTQTIGPIGLAAIIAAKMQRKKVISFVHSIEAELVPKAIGNNWLKQIIQPIAKIYSKIMYKLSDRIIVPSEGVVETLTWMKIKKTKSIVNLGTNTKQFKPMQQKALRKKLGINDEIVIGYHGRIAWEKDIITLLRAFKRVRRKYPELKLLVVGSGVTKILKKLDAAQNVILVESTPEVNKYLQIMDIYVMPSLTETTCLSVLEAMATELAVISTPVGYVQDYISEGQNGLFFHKTDSFMLSKNIELLINNPKLRKKLGKNARQVVEKKFRWDNTRTGILAEFKKL